jgi:hypothetical protein
MRVLILGPGPPISEAAAPGLRAEEHDGHDGQVTGIDHELQRRGGVAITEEAVQYVPERAALRQQASRVPHRRVEHGQPAELLEIFHGVGEQSCGKDHQQHADDREEPRQVEPVTQPVDHEREGERASQSDRRTAQSACRRGGEDDRQGEDHRLKPFAADGLKCQQPQSPPGPAIERRVSASAQFPRQRPSVLAHPERHVGQHGRGDKEGGSLEDRLYARAVVAANSRVGHGPACGRHNQCRAHADEHVTEVLPPPDAVEVRQQDCDDHACFDALAQEDDERGEHQVTSSSRTWSTNSN